jgi:hypothetical protein
MCDTPPPYHVTRVDKTVTNQMGQTAFLGEEKWLHREG